MIRRLLLPLALASLALPSLAAAQDRAGIYDLPTGAPTPATDLPALRSGDTLTVIDPAPLSKSDLMMREAGFGFADLVQDNSKAQGRWGAGYARWGGQEIDDAQDSDFHTRGFVLGQGLGWQGLSAFVGYVQGQSDMEDGDHYARIRTYLYGLATEGTRGKVDYGATLFSGGTHNKVAGTRTGGVDNDGRLWGLSLLAGSPVWEGIGAGPMRFDLQTDYLHHETEGGAVADLRADTDRRVAHVTRLKAELSMPIDTTWGTLTPYGSLAIERGEGDDIDIAVSGAATSVPATDLLDRDVLTVGAEMRLPAGFDGRLEISHATWKTGAALGLTKRF